MSCHLKKILGLAIYSLLEITSFMVLILVKLIHFKRPSCAGCGGVVTPVIATLVLLRQQNYFEFQVTLGYIVSSYQRFMMQPSDNREHHSLLVYKTLRFQPNNPMWILVESGSGHFNSSTRSQVKYTALWFLFACFGFCFTCKYICAKIQGVDLEDFWWVFPL